MCHGDFSVMPCVGKCIVARVILSLFCAKSPLSALEAAGVILQTGEVYFKIILL